MKIEKQAVAYKKISSDSPDFITSLFHQIIPSVFFEIHGID